MPEERISFPHYVMTRMFSPGDSRTHLVEEVMANVWSLADHSHVFRVEFLEETASWEAFWIEAPASFWDAFLTELKREHDKSLDDVLEGLESLLLEEPDVD